MNTNERKAKRISGLTLLRALAVLIAVVLAGCVQKTSVPAFARAGDTIVLGLGGIQRNVSGEQHLSASDLVITATKAGSNTPTTLVVQYVFKTFPEYASQFSSFVISGANPAANFPPFDGGWFVSVTLDSNMAVGSYTISITSPTNKLINTKFQGNGNFNEGDLTSLPLEIVAGAGGNSAYASEFSAYTNISSLDISPSSLSGVTAASGAQLAMTFPTAHYDTAHPPLVLPYSHNPYIQLSQNVVDNGNGTSTLYVLLGTQQAFVTKTNQTALTPLLSDLSLHIMYFIANGQNVSAAQAVSDFQLDLSRSHYYDTSGAVIATMTPTLTYKAN